MDDRSLRAVFEQLGAAPQPVSTINLDLARARGRRRMRWRRTGAFGTPMLAIGLAAGLLVAGVVPWSSSHGSGPSPAQAPKIRGFLTSVSCQGRSQCVAVGEYYQPGPRYALIEHTDGGRWSIMKAPTPPPHDRAALYGISCATASNCMAVGALIRVQRQPTTALVSPSPLIEHWNGSAWTVVQTPRSTAPSGQLEAVSCADASHCMAVGTTAGARALGEAWNGSGWAVVPTPSPAGAGYSALSSVSCTSAVSCMAVGEYFPTGNAQDHNHILVERWNGAAWTIADAVPRPAGSIASYLLGVSCSSGRNCVAVGSASFPHRKGSSWGGTRDLTLVERWNGAAWSIARTPGVPGPPSERLSGVACMTASDCTAAGAAARRSRPGGADRSGTLIEHWNGTAWSIVKSPSPSPSSGLSQVACTTASNCTAVGGYGGLDNPRTPHTLIEGWNGSAWSLPR